MFNKEINNSVEYDEYLLENAHSYMVTQFLGRGKYDKKYFKKIESAKKYYFKIKSNNQLSKLIVYAISKPPHSSNDINIAVTL